MNTFLNDILTNISIFDTIIFLLVIFVLVLTLQLFFKIDSFVNPVQKVVAKDPYDEFYAPVYTTLISDNIKTRTKFEVNDLIEKTKIHEYPKATLLDIGCGGGDHLRWLADENISSLELVGLDSSEHMLNETKDRIGKIEYPVRLINKDVNEEDLFMRASFSHITCYYFTLYYVNSKIFMKTIRSWLRPKGWFVVHMVDLEKFDPVLDVAYPFAGISPQKYVKNRITESSVHFKKFLYTSNFVLTKTKAYFDESFKFKNSPKIRTQRHTLKKIDMNKFVDNMGKLNMELKYTTNLDGYGYHDQSILYFQKT